MYNSSKKKYKVDVVCQICGLRTHRKDGHKRMFMARFPNDIEMAKKWVQVTGKQVLAFIPMKKLRCKYICGNHFRPSDFQKSLKKLKPHAVPSVEINVKPLPDNVLAEFPLQIHQDDNDSPISHPFYDVSIIELHDHDYCLNKKKKDNPTSIQEPSVVVTMKNTSCDNSTYVLEDFSLVKKVTFEDSSLGKQVTFENSSLEKQVTFEDSSLGKQVTFEDSSLGKQVIFEEPSLGTPVEFEYHTIRSNKDVVAPINSDLKDHNKSLENSKSKAPEMVKDKVNSQKSYLLKPRKHIFTTGSGLYSTVLSNLKLNAVKTIAQEKVCVLLFDEIRIQEHIYYNTFLGKVVGYSDLGDEGGRRKEVADHVLLFMLSNVLNKTKKPFFKQPIAHYFFKSKMSTEVLSNILKTVIKSVRAAGCTVIASVCDDKPSHVDALNLLKGVDGNPEEVNYYFVDDEKIYIIYDVPHLFMAIRNNLIQYGELVMDNKKVKWSHVIMAEQKNRSTYNFCKIRSHVDEVNWSRRGIKLAIQILSNTMAGILKLLSESMENEMDEYEIFQAGEVIENLDKLFDCTNGPTHMKDEKEHRQFVSTDSIHHELWVECKRILNNTYFLGESGHCLYNIRCIKSYITTISSLQDIWKYVKDKHFKFLNLRKFNLDGLYSLFGCFKEEELLSNSLTCYDIELPLNTFIPERSNQSLETTCANDNVAFYNFLNKESIAKVSDIELLELFTRFDKLPIVYMSGYLASVILKNESCQKCCSVLKVTEPEEKSIDNYNLLKFLWSEKISMVYPTNKLCVTVLKAMKVFERDVRPVLHIKNILNYSVIIMSNNCDVTWMCNQHKTSMSKQLFQHLSYLLIGNTCRLHNMPVINQSTKQTSSN